MRFALRSMLGIFVSLLLGMARAAAEPSPVCTPRDEAPLLAYDLEPVLSGLHQPTSAAYANDGTARLFITEKTGLIRIVQAGELLPEPFLDLRQKVLTRGEEGLLSIAFPPDFRRSQHFFVFYTAAQPGSAGEKSVVSRLELYSVSAEQGNRAEPRGRVVLSLPQTRLPIHKGGQLQFGPDGYLYVSFGDGDLPDEAQRLDSLRGKILRLEVAADGHYTVPTDNPFVGRAGARAEIWAYGLRNPWRFSIDPCTGALFAGDVGSEQFEEINMVQAGGNYGWPPFEGVTCVGAIFSCGLADLTFPILTYGHLGSDSAGGNAVIGGAVYRGHRYPQLRGRYLFSDFASRSIWALTRRRTAGWQRALLGTAPEPLSAFMVDARGELFALGFASGTLYRLDPEELDFAEADLRGAEAPRTLALKGFAKFAATRRVQHNAVGAQSSVTFHLAERQRLALYFDALSPVAGQELTISLNGQVVSSYPFKRGSWFDWLALEGKKGRNELVFDYGVKAEPFSLRFSALELDALGRKR